MGMAEFRASGFDERRAGVGKTLWQQRKLLRPLTRSLLRRLTHSLLLRDRVYRGILARVFTLRNLLSSEKDRFPCQMQRRLPDRMIPAIQVSGETLLSLVSNKTTPSTSLTCPQSAKHAIEIGIQGHTVLAGALGGHAEDLLSRPLDNTARNREAGTVLQVQVALASRLAALVNAPNE